jgi:endonuclease I
MDKLNNMVHVAKLPLGYTAHFSWQDSGMKIEWEPEFPLIRSPRQRRKFIEAYQAARNDFAQSVATVLGGAVLRPAVRQ